MAHLPKTAVGVLLADQPDETLPRRHRAAPGSAVIICDMWDADHCVSAARRVVEMAPRMNAVVAMLREQDALIIHAPGDCMAFSWAHAPRLRGGSAIQPRRAVRLTSSCTGQAWKGRHVNRWRYRLGSTIIASGPSLTAATILGT
jgi:hypothetical protein